MKDYKPRLSQIYIEVSAISIVLAIIYFTKSDSLTFLIIFGVGYLIFRISITLPGISGVRLETDEIVIRYLIPFKKDKRIRYSDVESYIPMSFPKAKDAKPFMAMLKAHGEKNEVLLTRQGIHGFDELNRILSDALPKPPTEPDEVVNSE